MEEDKSEDLFFKINTEIPPLPPTKEDRSDSEDGMSIESVTSGSEIENPEDSTTLTMFIKPYYPEVQTVHIALNLK